MKKLILKVSDGKPERLAILLFMALLGVAAIIAMIDPETMLGVVALGAALFVAGFVLHMIWMTFARDLFYRISFHLIHWAAKDR